MNREYFRELSSGLAQAAVIYALFVAVYWLCQTS
jgi:hypothetical protein